MYEYSPKQMYNDKCRITTQFCKLDASLKIHNKETRIVKNYITKEIPKNTIYPDLLSKKTRMVPQNPNQTK